MPSREETVKNNLQILDALNKDSINPELHYWFGVTHLELGNIFIANAELGSALALGYRADNMDILLQETYKKFGLEYDIENPEVEKVNQLFFRNNLEHNQYYRINSLAEYISTIQKTKDGSVLDIGGGDGKLAFFLPHVDYCLVEPGVNGISGTNLPFQDNSFDTVTACHVLEHIPEEQRDTFLDQLCSKAKSDVILMNPFNIDNTFPKERLELVIELTNADWAKEHLECGLPDIEYVKDYAQRKGISIEIKPNGTLSTSFLMTLVQHYSLKSGCAEEFNKISKFYNENLYDILDSESYPTAYLIHFELKSKS